MVAQRGDNQMAIAKKIRDMLLPTAANSPRAGELSLARICLHLNDVAEVKKITAAFTTLFALAVTGCSLFGSGEAVKQGSGRTVYRAEEAPPDLSDAVPAPVPQDVPGEKRSKLF